MVPRHTEDPVAEAVKNLERQSLAQLSGEISKLVYLASTRDYNTGHYYHDGLASRFGEEAAGAALAAAHHEIFLNLVQSPLQKMVDELDSYFGSLPAKRRELLAAWKKLEPYRVVVPAAADAVSSQLFCSNVKLALAILAKRQNADPNAEPGASPHLSLVQ
jgi:hypothetical protein